MPATPKNPYSERLSLKNRVLRGGAWSLVGYGLSQALRFGSNLVMTRLLVPDAFALMAIATVVMIGLTMFSDLGLKPIIIQSTRGNDAKFLNTAWTVQIIRGAFLWLIAIGISFVPLLASSANLVAENSVYADPRLPYVIVALSFSLFIGGLNSTKIFEASRRLTLGPLTALDLITQVVGLFCLYIWILFDRSISALVAGNIAAALAMMLWSYFWLPGTRNHLEWDKSAIEEIVHFGKWIFLSSILGFLVSSGDRLLLGGMIDKSVLGVYVIAFSIINSVEAVLLTIIARISLPALSEIARDRPQVLQATYYRIHTVVASFAYFCAGVFVMSGQSLVNMLYDLRYAQAGWMTEILAVTLLATPFQISIQGFLALGKPQLHSNVLAVRLVALFTALPLGIYFFGLPGALWGIVLSQILCLPMIATYSARCRLFDPKQELRLLPVVFLGLGAGWMLALIIDSYFGT